MEPPSQSESERWAWEHSPEPGWIDAPGGPLFSWYHAPAGPPRKRAILLCEPLGHDRMNLHLTYRHLALHLSRAGYPTLRFDYAGTGDSSGSSRDPDWAANWETGLEAACDTLLDRSQTSHLVLFGARIGATLAARFAYARSEVDALILWGAYLKGRAFLRNESVLHRIIGANPASRQPRHADPKEREFIGFLYSASARAELESIDLLSKKDRPCRHARIFGWDGESSEDQLASHLLERGTQVEFSRFEDSVSEASLTEQHVPEALLRETVAWLDGLPPLDTATTRVEGSDGRRLRSSVFRSATTRRAVEEEAVFFGGDGGIFGILSQACHPDQTAPKKPALILVSGGNNPRAGINRNYTEWARDAALRGTTTLRFDIRGLGDSPPLLAHDLNQLYRDETVKDLRAAIDFLESRGENSGIILCGLCAGAFQALHTALVDSRVTGVLFLDLLRWDKDPTQVRRPGFFDRRRRSIERISRRLRARFGGSERPADGSLLGDQLSKLVDREVDLVAIGCRTRGGHDHFVEAIASRRAHLDASDRFRLEGLDNTDHIFSPLWAQEWLADLLESTVEAFSESVSQNEDSGS